MQIKLEKIVKCQIHLFQVAPKGPRSCVTRAFLTTKNTKLQEATRIPSVYHPYTMPGSQPYTTVYLRIPAVYHPYTTVAPVYHRTPSVHDPYTTVYRPYTTLLRPPSPCLQGFQVLFFPKALRRVLPENPLNTDTSTLTLTH